MQYNKKYFYRCIKTCIISLSIWYKIYKKKNRFLTYFDKILWKKLKHSVNSARLKKNWPFEVIVIMAWKFYDGSEPDFPGWKYRNFHIFIRQFRGRHV